MSSVSIYGEQWLLLKLPCEVVNDRMTQIVTLLKSNEDTAKLTEGLDIDIVPLEGNLAQQVQRAEDNDYLGEMLSAFAPYPLYPAAKDFYAVRDQRWKAFHALRDQGGKQREFVFDLFSASKDQFTIVTANGKYAEEVIDLAGQWLGELASARATESKE